LSVSHTKVITIPNGFGRLFIETGDRYAYALVCPKNEKDKPPIPYTIQVFDWSETNDAGPMWSRELNFEWMWMEKIGGRLLIYGASQGVPGGMAVTALDDPRELVESTWPFHATGENFLWYGLAWARMYGAIPYDDPDNHTPAMDVTYDPDRDLAYFTYRNAFEVRDDALERVARYRFNPLASMFRGHDAHLRLIGHDRVLEAGESVLSVFDVSDPRRPRRIGWFNVAVPRGADAFPMGDHLLLIEPGSLTVLELPEPESRITVSAERVN
jgi:hypothetical protein